VGPFVLPRTPEQAVEALDRFGRVVLKPARGSAGSNVHTGLSKPGQVREAFARIEGLVVAQKHLPGDDHRVLVVGQQRVFAVRRVPAFVVGDGTSTIDELIDAWNESVILRNRRIEDQEAVERALSKQGFQRDSVPPDRAQVRVADLANAQRGGFAIDVTDLVCDEVLDIAREVARMFRCDYVGVDFMSDDIAADPGQIIEVNPHAGLTLHHHPTLGRPRDVAGAILDHLFPGSR
jgi:cyanophycin synthetase